MFPWGDERRFNSYSRYCKTHFSGRVQKLPVDSGFSCPNRTSRSEGGCTHCANAAFSPAYLSEDEDVVAQLEQGKRFFERRYPSNNGYFAYFQAYTNTFAPLTVLREKFEAALTVPDVKGLVISTRPDCLPDAVLDYLSELSSRTNLTVEIGVESLHNETLAHIRRGHTVECAFEAFRRLRERGIPSCAHLIFGLPGETPGMWLEDVLKINEMRPRFVKFHQLQVFRDTPMEAEFAASPDRFRSLAAEEYVRFMCDYLERLSPEIVVERFSAEAPPRFLSVLRWNLLRHDTLVRKIESELTVRDTFQGRLS